MVSPVPELNRQRVNSESIRIVAFNVEGGIFERPHHIRFPVPSPSPAAPEILILGGLNGCGKTTVLRMISGILELNFDVFRKIPFKKSSLELSDGSTLSVESVDNPLFPLRVTFRDLASDLFKQRLSEDDAEKTYSPQQRKDLINFRQLARPVVRRINFQLLDIHRSVALRDNASETERASHIDWNVKLAGPYGYTEEKISLAKRVLFFVREAQVNYRRFFAANELELLPRIVERFAAGTKPSTVAELSKRVESVQSRFGDLNRLGLQTDDADLKALKDVLATEYSRNSNALILLGAYVEMQESRQKARELVATRLLEFEKIMDEFLTGKSVRIEGDHGLQIVSNSGLISETELSSGEYHFLYMMVSALLCQSTGSIIAIDEPELSLHVTWQRKLLDALAKCAAGASPIFLFATHSAAIAAEHEKDTYYFTPLE